MTTVRDSAGRRRRNVDGYRCASCGQWSPADHWDETVCPTCHEMHAELPKLECRWLHVVKDEPRVLAYHETLRQLAPPGHIDHRRPAEGPTRGTV